MQQSIVAPLLVVWLLCVAHFASSQAVAYPASPDAGLPIQVQQSGAALKPGAGEPASGQGEAGCLAEEVVSTWAEQALEWDELTRCIQGSEAGNAIERWLDCLESLDDAPVLKLLETGEPGPSGVSAGSIGSDATVNGSLQLSEVNMEAFDPLSGRPAPNKNFGSSDRNSEVIEGLGLGWDDTTAEMAQGRFSHATQKLEAAAVPEDRGFGLVPRIGHGDEIKRVSRFSSDSSALSDTEMSSSQISSEDSRLPGKGDTRGATDISRSSSKWGTEISSVSGDSGPLRNR